MAQKTMNRRFFGEMVAAGAIGVLAGGSRSNAAITKVSSPNRHIRESSDGDLQSRWRKLDDAVHGWWNGDLHKAEESAIRKDPAKTLLFLPFPYSTAAGSQSAFPEMYGWDTQFMNLALLIQDRADIVRWHILNQLFMIERFGKVLNGNRTYYLTRSQPPLWAWSIGNYLGVKNDNEVALLAYAELEREYTGYWNGPGHATPTGLSTCRDSGDKTMNPALAAECETGLDFTPIFGRDVRRCVPIHINSALVRYAQVLGALASRFGWHEKATAWQEDADRRARQINEYCWDESKGFYFEYDFVKKKRLPCYSLNAYWPLWAGVASKNQARRVVSNLARFDRPFGLTFTDRQYPDPYPQFKALEWAYPEAWPPQEIIVSLALRKYGYRDEMRKISLRYIRNVIQTWEKTGYLWERYNAVTGGHIVPVERTAPARFHGWSSASAVVVGRMAFGLDTTGNSSEILTRSE